MRWRRLQEAGTYHVIAISGGNIAILAGAGAPRSEVRTGLAVSGTGRRDARGIAGQRRVVGGPCHIDGHHLFHGAVQRSAPSGNVAAVSAAVLCCMNPLEVVDAASR